MPPKKANSKKGPTKIAASSADAEVLNNGEKEVEEIATDAKILANGDLVYDENDAKASPKLKAIKRSGRAKNVAPEVDAEAPTGKKPVAKGRGRKKLNENEVIENESNSSQAEAQETDDTKLNSEIKIKPKGRGGGKKADAKKAPKVNEIKDQISAEEQEDDTNQVEEVKVSEKNTKSGRKKKQEISPKKDDQVEQQQDIVETTLEEKDSKKNNKNAKKSEEIVAVIEPQKKKGRAAKKEKHVEKDNTELPIVEEVKTDAKGKKPAKRGRAAASKAVPITDETAALNGDAEEVLPKKRSRKAPSVEKEIVKEKPKRGRAKKFDKEEIEVDAELKGNDAETSTNGEDNLEKIEEIEG